MFKIQPPTEFYALSLPTLFRSRRVPVRVPAARSLRGRHGRQGNRQVTRPGGRIVISIPRQESFMKLIPVFAARSEEHTSELQSRRDLVCRLLLEKKKTITKSPH